MMKKKIKEVFEWCKIKVGRKERKEKTNRLIVENIKLS